MPRGGKRAGAGRKAGGVTKKSRAVANTIVESGNTTPLSYMLRVMSDESAEQQRRDEMARSAAPFCHARLNATATVNAPANSCGPLQIAIFSVPHGAQIQDGRIVWPDGSEATAAETEFRPYEATPALPALMDQSAAVEPLEVVEPEPEDDGKVTPLSAWRRRDGDGV
jgi:hypothetical protein